MQHHLTIQAQHLALEQYLVRWGKLRYGECIRALEQGSTQDEIAVRAHYLTLPPKVVAQLIQDTSQRIRFAMHEMAEVLTEEVSALLSPPPGHARVLWLADVPVRPGETMDSLVARGVSSSAHYEVLHPDHPDGVQVVTREQPHEHVS